MEQIFRPQLLHVCLILCALSFSLAFLIILSSRFFKNFRRKQDQFAVQSAHSGFVPRIGGVAVYLSFFSFIYLFNSGVLLPSSLSLLELGSLYLLVLSVLPIFFVGLAEDLGYFMSPKSRLLASAISGLLVLIFFQNWVSGVGIPGFDVILSIAPLGIFFTLFATVGVVNSFNLIDGLNGLASYVAMSSAIALSLIAFQIGNSEIMNFLFLLSACVAGFFILNFPLGKIFLGDAGAYMLGHLIVWSAILLVNIDNSISPFAVLLIFFWPVADTLLSVWRRYRSKKKTYQPDRLHFHQVVMRLLEIRFLGRNNRFVTNPLATIILVPVISVPQILGVVFWENLTVTVGITIMMSILFLSTYSIGLSLIKKPRITDFSSN